MKKNRYKPAFASLRRLRNTDIQAARDLFYIHAQLKEEQEFREESSYLTRLLGLLKVKRIRSATIASFVAMVAQQLCGGKSSSHIALREKQS